MHTCQDCIHATVKHAGHESEAIELVVTHVAQDGSWLQMDPGRQSRLGCLGRMSCSLGSAMTVSSRIPMPLPLASNSVPFHLSTIASGAKHAFQIVRF